MFLHVGSSMCVHVCKALSTYVCVCGQRWNDVEGAHGPLVPDFSST